MVEINGKVSVYVKVVPSAEADLTLVAGEKSCGAGPGGPVDDDRFEDASSLTA